MQRPKTPHNNDFINYDYAKAACQTLFFVSVIFRSLPIDQEVLKIRPMSDDPPSPKRLKKDDHQENNSRSTMLILVGLPGSGKSTLASSLLRQSPRQWARINQDSINKGKRGTRDMCLKAAKLAIQQGYDVIIDRTSVTPEHRKYFIDLALAEGVDPSHIHCIFLNLPVKQCGARAAGRESHEGGLTGNGAYGIVGVMQKQLAAAGPPSVSEGFASLIECQNDDEINLALDLWVRHSTQIYNGEGEVLNLTAEWEKLKPKRKPSGGGGGLQSLDKFFIKKPTDKNTTNTRNAGGGDGAGPSSSAATKQVAASTGATTKNTENISNPSQPNKGENAFNILMAASKQQQHSSPSPAKKQPAATAGAPGTRHHFRAAAALYALQRYLNNPEQLLTNSTSTTDDNTVLYCDSQCVIIPDKFPKSRYHVLVLGRNQRLQGPLDLTGADSALVRHMMVRI